MIGAAIDLTKNMAPFDAPALEAAQIEIKKINAAGGVDGRPLEMKSLNDQLDPTQTEVRRAQARRARASTSAGSPATSTTRRRRSRSSSPAKLLTVSPCIGTDQMGPSTLRRRRATSPSPSATPRSRTARRSPSGPTASGWHTADVVTDKLLVYFQNVCQAFTLRFQQLGGKIVDQESFTQGDKTIGNVATRVNGKKASVIAFCTSFGTDQPAFVDGLRTLGNKTPIIDGWAQRRRLLVVEEPQDHQLLLPHLRVGADARIRPRR